MEKKFDPMTGKPIVEKKFDPMTGEPITEKKFDPMTGKPVMEKKFDPMTGKPVMERRFDPKTGKPLKGAPGTKKKKGGKVIIIAAVAVVVVAAGVFAMAKSGVFLSSSNKVLLAAANTLQDTTPLIEDLTALEIKAGDEFTVEAGFENEYASASGTIVNAKDEKQVKIALDGEDIPEVEAIAGLDEEYLTLQIPSFSDNILAYNYTKEKTGFLSELIEKEDLDMMDELIAAVYEGGDSEEMSKEIQELLEAEYEELEFEKADKEEFEVNDKDVKCKGYLTTISEDNFIDLIDGIEEIYGKYYDDSEMMYEMTGTSVADMFEEMRYSFEDMPDIDTTFYIYKNKLACIRMEADSSEIDIRFLGGDVRMQNIEIIADDEKVMTLKGKTDGSEETLRLISYDTEVMKLKYDSKSGEFSVDLDEGSMYVEGVLTVKKNELTLDVESLEEYDEYLGSGFVSVSKGASIEKLEGELADIGEASESELEDIVLDYEDLISEFY